MEIGVNKWIDIIKFLFSCLPNDLEGAVRQSGQASAEFVFAGGTRAIVCTCAYTLGLPCWSYIIGKCMLQFFLWQNINHKTSPL